MRVGGLGGPQLQVFGVTYFAYAVLYIGRKCLSVAKPAMVQSGVASTAELGAIDTSFLVCYAVGQLCLSGVAEQLGPRRGLTLCYAAVAASLLAFVRCVRGVVAALSRFLETMHD